ncbi:MAG: DMT family transporter [Burkholderiales bacterium]
MAQAEAVAVTSARPTRPEKKGVALAALFAGAVAIGTSALLVKLSEAGPVSTAFWRVFLALPVLCAWDWLERRHPERAASPPGSARLIVLAGFCFAGDLAVWHWSIVLTSVANATLLANCAPIFVALAAWLFLRKRLERTFVTGLAMAIVGMALLLRGDFGHGGAALAGDALGLVTAMFYAAYQLTVTRARNAISTARIMAGSGLVTAAILLPLALVSGEQFLPHTASGWATLIALALVSQAAGQSLIAYAMAHLPATFSSVGLLLHPVVAAILAWVVLGETLTALAIAGGILVLIGIRVAHSAGREA